MRLMSGTKSWLVGFTRQQRGRNISNAAWLHIRFFGNRTTIRISLRSRPSYEISFVTTQGVGQENAMLAAPERQSEEKVIGSPTAHQLNYTRFHGASRLGSPSFGRL